MLKSCLVWSIVVVLGPSAIGQSVRTKAGSIYLLRPGRPELQLTSGGGDSDPSLSADGSRVVFVRRKPRPNVGLEATQLWTIDPKAAVQPSLLLDSPVIVEGEMHSSFSKPQFSPDNT